jgi:hypothetical protein
MKFFFPAAAEGGEQHPSYEKVREHISKLAGTKLRPRCLFRLVHRHQGKTQVVEVGKPHPVSGEPVVVIFSEEPGKLFHVCTFSRGVRYDGSIAVDAASVGEAEYFEDEAPN